MRLLYAEDERDLNEVVTRTLLQKPLQRGQLL